MTMPFVIATSTIYQKCETKEFVLICEYPPLINFSALNAKYEIFVESGIFETFLLK